MTEQWRAQFDAELTFSNGGGLSAHGFRLDVRNDAVSPDELAELFVRHLGLLMVDAARVSDVTFLREPHKGSRAVYDTAAAGESARQGHRLVELSHPITAGMITYPGLPGPEIDEHLTREASRAVYASGTEFSIGRITMVGNTGTYLDSPYHRYDGGTDLAGLPVASVADLDGLVVRVAGSTERAIDRSALFPFEVAGKAVLIHTGWDRHWGTDRYGSGHPYLTDAAAGWLADQRAALVGIDSLNIDDTATGHRPAHSLLLAAGIPIVEHLRGLDRLPPHGFRFHAAPPAVVGFGTFPVRAYAVLAG